MAAFGTAVSWTLSAVLFERGIKHIGVTAVNFFKVALAFVFLAVTAGFLRGMPLPADAPLKTWAFLALSGLVGFVIGDTFLFNAYRTAGPRIGMLFMALSPPVTAGIAYIFLGEALGGRGFLGMVLVVAGICITIFGKQNSLALSKMKSEDKSGYLYAFLASLGISIGMILTKTGLGDYDPVSGTQIRVLSAVIGFAFLSILRCRGEDIGKAAGNREGLKFTAVGAVFGPFVGVTLSLFAIQRTSAGITSTLIGLTPVLIIIPETLVFRKKIKPLEIIGALIAVGGTTVFFL